MPEKPVRLTGMRRLAQVLSLPFRPGVAREFLDRFAGFYPSRFTLTAFGLLVLLFTGLLALPISSTEGRATSFAEALFSATSAISVTGLSVVDSTTHWSAFGEAVIVIAAQIGGIGVLTLASVLGMIVSRRLGLRQRILAAGDMNPMNMGHATMSEGQAVRLGDVKNILNTVAISTLVIEAGLMVLYIPAVMMEGRGLLTALWQSGILAALSFTNTGIVPFQGGIDPFADNVWFLLVTMLGVSLGSLGFPVIFAIVRDPQRPHRWSLHVKLTLATTVLLFVGGAALISLLEWGNPQTLGETDPLMRPLWGAYYSAMMRSGGFAIFDPSHMGGASLLLSNVLMFIGGGSASTAGGIKVTTFAVLFLAALAEARGRTDIEAFERRIPSDVLRVSVSVVLWGASIVLVATILVTQISHETLDLVLFDVISAFATVGLSTGVTERLPDAAMYVMSATMFAGRVGTVTLAAALAARHKPQLFVRPEERPIVG